MFLIFFCLMLRHWKKIETIQILCSVVDFEIQKVTQIVFIIVNELFLFRQNSSYLGDPFPPYYKKFQKHWQHFMKTDKFINETLPSFNIILLRLCNVLLNAFEIKKRVCDLLLKWTKFDARLVENVFWNTFWMKCIFPTKKPLGRKCWLSIIKMKKHLMHKSFM